MSDGTHIEWTDMTANFINGCSVVSPGCTNCYAMKQAHRFPVRQGLTRKTNGGMVWTGEVRRNEKVLLDVLRLKRPRKIFWNAHGDTFHERVPDEWIDAQFAVMALTPHHIHQVLTKRIERAREYMSGFEDRPAAFGAALAKVVRAAGLPKDAGLIAIDEMTWPLPNVWLGTSVEDQKRADERIPILLDTPAAVRWLSCEPLLGPVDLRMRATFPDHIDRRGRGYWDGLPRIDWIVAGGESGPGARPMHPDWARSLRDQCAAAAVPFLFKQWGNFRPCTDAELRRACGATLVGDRVTGAYMMKDSKKATGRLLDGVQHDGYPA